MSSVPGLTDLDLKLASAEVTLSAPNTPPNASLGAVELNEQEHPSTENGCISELELKTPIPISQQPVGEALSVPSLKRGRRKKGVEDELGEFLPVEQNPEWLPLEWKVMTRIRPHGKSAGSKDTYYIEPKKQRQFRSKKEVLDFVATGTRRSHKKMKTIEDNPSAAPLMITQPRPEPSSPPEKVTWAFGNSGESFWVPFIGEAMVPEHIRLEWAAMFNHILPRNNSYQS